MPNGVSEHLREQVSLADRNHCACCQTSEANCGIPLTIDHIQPISKGGETSFENLCLGCRPCNEFKATLTEAEDPLTDQIVPLFKPVHNRGRSTSAGAPTPPVSKVIRLLGERQSLPYA